MEMMTRIISRITLMIILLSGLCNGMNLSSNSKRKVLVTGAAGRTGKLVFSQLLEDPQNEPVGLVRTETSARKLQKEIACNTENICVCDITKMDDTLESRLSDVLSNTEAMVICTSAVPKLSKQSIVKELLRIPLNIISGKKAFNFRALRFTFRAGQYPEKVDYLGQVALIDLAKKFGIKHVVVVSSMGGTDKNNFLNTIGKNADGTGNGDILIWKRKAEKYLIESGLRYTIIHPGGLKDTPGGLSNFILDVDDNLLKREKRSISRADVARLCIAALNDTTNRSVSLDCITEEVIEGQQIKSASSALSEFLLSRKTCDYNLN